MTFSKALLNAFPPNTRLLSFAIIYFILYFSGALFFYKERIFLDGAYYFFHVIQAENFRVEHQRFILIPSQLLLLAAVKLHLPMEWLMVFNSLNPGLYLLILFILCVGALRDVAAGWALMLVGVCGIYFLYFCPMYEVWYGAALLIFFSSLINKRFYNTTWQLLGVAIASVTLLFSYPLMIVGLIFILLYHFLEIRKVPMKLAAILGIVCIFWLVWKILFLSEYETGKIDYPLSQITKIAKENFGSVTNIITLITFLIRIYTEEIIAFLIVTTMLIFRRKYELALLVGFFIGGFILLVNLTQNTPWHHSNYFERLYLLLVPMCLIPFLHEVYEPAYKKLIFEVIFICIIFWRGIQIFHHSDYYSTRISQVEFFIDQANKMNGSKFFVDEQKYSGNSALNEWSFPMETLILSSLKRNESVTISLKSDIENIENSSKLMPDNFHLRLNEILKIEELNRNYFRLERGNYQNLDTK